MKIKRVSNSNYFCIESENNKYRTLGRFIDDNWRENSIVEMIDGINTSKENLKGRNIFWANEDVTLHSNKNGVLSEDMMPQRFGENSVEELTLRLEHDLFIQFL